MNVLEARASFALRRRAFKGREAEPLEAVLRRSSLCKSPTRTTERPVPEAAGCAGASPCTATDKVAYGPRSRYVAKSCCRASQDEIDGSLLEPSLPGNCAAAAMTGTYLREAPLALQIGMFWGASSAAGGLDRIYTDLFEHLPKAGFRTIGVVEGPMNVYTSSAGRVHPFRRGRGNLVDRYTGFRSTISSLIREQPVDLVALHFALYGAFVLDKLRQQPLVMHFHGPWSTEGQLEGSSRVTTNVKHFLEAAVYRRADRIIVLSAAFSDLIQQKFGVCSERVRLVPGHVDLERFARSETRKQARERLGLPTDRPLLVSVRRLKHRMGLDRLIAAMASVRQTVPDALLCIGGTGDLRPALQRQVAEFGLGDHVRFLGYVPEEDLSFLYRAADLNVVPTLALEGFGLVAAEALAAGTPSIVTPIGGLPEVVAPLSEALVCESSDVDAIADRLASALTGRVAMPDQIACETYARAMFSVSLAAQRTAAVYNETLR